MPYTGKYQEMPYMGKDFPYMPRHHQEMTYNAGRPYEMPYPSRPEDLLYYPYPYDMHYMGASGGLYTGGLGAASYMAPSHSHMGGSGKPRMGTSVVKGHDGSRSKAAGDQWGHGITADQWGHFPSAVSPQSANQNSRWERERRRERELRRPNQAFFNANYNAEDDEIEFISA